jgi:hypothetical protein
MAGGGGGGGNIPLGREYRGPGLRPTEWFVGYGGCSKGRSLTAGSVLDGGGGILFPIPLGGPGGQCWNEPGCGYVPSFRPPLPKVGPGPARIPCGGCGGGGGGPRPGKGLRCIVYVGPPRASPRPGIRPLIMGGPLALP